MLKPVDTTDVDDLILGCQIKRLKLYREQASFFTQTLMITMVSGKQYTTVQYLNALVLKKPLLIAMQKQGFITIDDTIQINPQHIESIELIDTDEAKSTYISSEGIAYLFKQGYTADGLILSKNMMAKALDYTKRHTLYEDDDL